MKYLPSIGPGSWTKSMPTAAVKSSNQGSPGGTLGATAGGAGPEFADDPQPAINAQQGTPRMAKTASPQQQDFIRVPRGSIRRRESRCDTSDALTVCIMGTMIRALLSSVFVALGLPAVAPV